MAVTKSLTLMLMIASFSSGGLAVLMAIAVGSREFLTYSAPGFIIGAFFAFKYATFDRNKQRAEEHEHKRRDRHGRSH